MTSQTTSQAPTQRIPKSVRPLSTKARIRIITSLTVEGAAGGSGPRRRVFAEERREHQPEQQEEEPDSHADPEKQAEPQSVANLDHAERIKTKGKDKLGKAEKDEQPAGYQVYTDHTPGGF